nr:YueI family protein [uncultured Bacillus sp.]
MVKPDLEDYLTQGIYGPKETNPDERRKFLGTLRERIEIALTKEQVMEETVYPEIEQAMKNHRETHLFLNGHLEYESLSKYIKQADKNSIPYTIVTNKEYNSEIALVLVHKEAVDKENIFVTKKYTIPEQQQKEKKGIFSFFDKILGSS